MNRIGIALSCYAPDSLYFLGLLKLYGISVTSDAVMAVDLLRKSAEMRHPEAMAALGVMLVNGRGTFVMDH